MIKYFSSGLYCVFIILISWYAMAGEAILEKVTIKNSSQQVINGLRIVSTFGSERDEFHQKVYIAPGTQKTYEIRVWEKGSFTVKVHYRYQDKKDKVSRSFVANLDTGEPITPVTLEFGGEEWGLWKGVFWDKP